MRATTFSQIGRSRFYRRRRRRVACHWPMASRTITIPGPTLRFQTKQPRFHTDTHSHLLPSSSSRCLPGVLANPRRRRRPNSSSLTNQQASKLTTLHSLLFALGVLVASALRQSPISSSAAAAVAHRSKLAHTAATAIDGLFRLSGCPSVCSSIKLRERLSSCVCTWPVVT